MQDKKKKKGFPDLNKDGKVTFKDILIGRGVIKKTKGGSLKGGQKKLDANKDGKISGKDFAVLRSEKAKGRGMGLQDEKLPPGKMVKAQLGKLIGKGAIGVGDEFIKRRMKLGAPSSIFKRASEVEEFVPKDRVKEAGVRGFLYGTGAATAGLGITGAEMEERDFKKARQEKETKERTATEGSFMGGGMVDPTLANYQKGGSVQARGVKLARTKPTKLY